MKKQFFSIANLVLTFCTLLLLAVIPLTHAADPQGKKTFSLDLPSKPWEGDLGGMTARRQIRVLVVNSKTLYFIDKGVQRGVNYDVFREFEEQLNTKLKTKNIRVNVVFIPVSRDQLIPFLLEGKGDIAAANLTITEERQKLVDFTDPVMKDVKEIVVSGPMSGSVAKIDDLAGRTFFVRKSSSYHASLMALNERFRKEGKAEVEIEEAPENLEDEDLLEMLQAGLIETMVVDDHKAKFWKQIFPQLTLHEDIALRSGGNIAWAIRKNSPRLMDELNGFIATHRKGTTFGNVVLQKYLKNTKYVKNATNEKEMEKFLELLQYFEKYGDQYELDWILMAAQGYQESGLDQNVKSPVGAIGVMQVMPATGKELKVGDIRKKEANIHAGVKYIRFMIDRYYKDEPMNSLNKGLFAFASYNAGPARVRSLRQEAASRGLDPNIWFNNVELVASERIGRETVTYVSNIYKYYIAYKLVQKQRLARKETKMQFRKSEL